MQVGHSLYNLQPRGNRRTQRIFPIASPLERAISFNDASPIVFLCFKYMSDSALLVIYRTTGPSDRLHCILCLTPPDHASMDLTKKVLNFT